MSGELNDLVDYKTFLGPHLGPGFGFREIVNQTRTHELPPRKMWPAMVRTLQLANELRDRIMKRGARGLLCNAAYRPKGGSLFSAHKKNIALDLDLMPGDYDMATGFVLEAVSMLCTHGATERLRIGVYGRPGSCASIRIHIDTNSGARGWQHYGGRELSLAKSDITTMAAKLGLKIPARM
jgi:hypothetical protein